MFSFLTRRHFLINLLVVALLAAGLVFLILTLLGVITKHSQNIKVPNVVNKATTAAVQELESKGFTVQITDSTYTDTARAGIVLKMIPEGNASVKVNRTIFLIVNRVIPPLIEMPKLEGLTTNFALAILERNHLKLLDTVFKPDIQKGSVIEQQFNGQKIIEKTKIPWGSKITLVIGAGIDNKQILMPSFVGLTYAEAKTMLSQYNLSLAATVPDGPIKDTANAYVIKQIPPVRNEYNEPNYIAGGQFVDLFISQTMKEVRDTSALQTKPIEKAKDDKIKDKTKDKTKDNNK
jgi:eukaryotic-like serine/threonine-protein kinase